MAILAILLGVLGVASLGFAWYGLETVAGRMSFDEMDGLIPMGAAVLGVACLCAAFFLVALRAVRAQRN